MTHVAKKKRANAEVALAYFGQSIPNHTMAMLANISIRLPPSVTDLI